MARRLTNIKRIIELYNDGYGTNKIAEIEGFHRSSIQYALKKSNVVLRKRSPLSKYNIYFFSKYNIDSCYWAGFFMSDGHIRKNGRSVDLHLAKKDLSHLEKFSEAIDYEGNIEKCKDGSVRLTVSGEWFVKDLLKNFLITKQKSLTCKFPRLIPKKYYSHFVRGIFDGDGCITHCSVLVINFTSNFYILKFLQDYFFDNLNIRIKRKWDKPKISNKGAYGQLSYSGKNAVKILDWFYHESSDKNRLNRKFNRYQEA